MENDLIVALLGNNDRRKMVAARDRRLNTSHDPYTQTELLEMFGPYFKDFVHIGLSPREVRLIETIVSLLEEREAKNSRPTYEELVGLLGDLVNINRGLGDLVKPHIRATFDRAESLYSRACAQENKI